MNAARLILRPWVWGGLLALAAVGVRADESPKPDSSLEIIQYKTPVGWKVQDRGGEGGRLFTAPDANDTQQAIIMMMLSPEKEGLDLRGDFDALLKKMSGNAGGKVLESSDVDSVKTRQGFDALTQTLITQVEGGQRVYFRMVAAKVQNRMAAFCYLATSEAFYDAHQPDMDALLKSVNFNATVGNPPGGAKAELAMLEKERQELLKKVAENEARQRQLGGVIPGGAAGSTASGTAAAAGGAPANSADGEAKLLAAAREKFATDLAQRRKAHTVLGDILMLNGKPIPNVAKYKVTVYGTTIAAEKTNYNFDVDANGHFEQQIPDGIYRIDVKCIVNYAGHRVPVDLVWLDEKQRYTDQASAAGIVRDYRLAMTGLKPGADPNGENSYNGGAVGVNGPPYDLYKGHLSARFPGAKVQIVMNPKGALVDGTQGGPIITDMDAEQVNVSTVLRSIPMGVYDVSATLIKKDGTKQALACTNDGVKGKYGNSAEIYWESLSGDEDRRSTPGLYLKD